jgi:hypothetical protein
VDETLPSDSKPSKKVLPRLEKIGGDEEFTYSPCMIYLSTFGSIHLDDV